MLLSAPIDLAHHLIADSSLAPLSLHCCTAIAPLLLYYCCSCCHYAVTPVIAFAVNQLSLRYRSAVAPLSLCCRFCRSVAAAIAPDFATLTLLLSLLLSLHCHS